MISCMTDSPWGHWKALALADRLRLAAAEAEHSGRIDARFIAAIHEAADLLEDSGTGYPISDPGTDYDNEPGGQLWPQEARRCGS
jgi:hypothetical protein